MKPQGADAAEYNRYAREGTEQPQVSRAAGEHLLRRPGAVQPRLAVAEPFVRGIETTNYCGCHCQTCPYDRMTRSKGKIDTELFKRAVENVLRYTAERIITLHHFGDPVLHPQLPALIDYAASRGLKTKISTVGVALTARLIDELVNSNLTVIKFSFWGTNKEEFERYQKASYRRTVENINAFIAKNKHVKVVIELLTNGSHDPARLEHYPLWKNMLQLKPATNWIGDDDKVIDHTGDARKIVSAPCEKLWKSELKILWNGDVVPCCMDYDGKAVIGTIKEQNLARIWYGEKINELRRLHLQGRRQEVELCKFCSHSSWVRPSREVLLR